MSIQPPPNPDAESDPQFDGMSDAKLAELERAERKEQVRAEFGDKARVVTPYVPNRRQRRAQEAARRAVLKGKTK